MDPKASRTGLEYCSMGSYLFRGTAASITGLIYAIYRHYDVISAPADGWQFDPFTLTGRNGYYYGRGATDNKGPILAAACAASELLQHRSLECDLILLVEGEEETGSAGFIDCVRKNKVRISQCPP